MVEQQLHLRKLDGHHKSWYLCDGSSFGRISFRQVLGCRNELVVGSQTVYKILFLIKDYFQSLFTSGIGRAVSLKMTRRRSKCMRRQNWGSRKGCTVVSL